jgi:5-methylcytosine-specific restriction endonuclease McrA
MAESDYRRLAPACHCGKPTKAKLGRRGRPPKYCEDHTGPARAEAKREIECPACRGIFIPARDWQVYCGSGCKARHKRGSKPKDEARSYKCKQCGSGFESTHSAPMYCTKACKQKAWELRDPERPKRAKKQHQPTLCAYFAKHCSGCGLADGRRRDWSKCSDCKRRDALIAARSASRLINEAMHKSAAVVVACVGCGGEFCPLYGNKTRKSPRCSVCRPELAKAAKRIHKASRKAKERGANSERVDPLAVFGRDGWVCRACGVETPREKRGTYDDDAPELDHIVPLSRGGAHSYANTQCLCRSCNGSKGAMTMEEFASCGVGGG